MKSHVFQINKDFILELQWVPPGEFLMGSQETESGHEESESPLHKVLFTKGFWMSRFPVTQKLWLAIMGSNPSKFVDPRQPVEMVNWNDAQEFVIRINESHQVTFSLPTEAEWEYACRAGATSRFFSGNSERDLDSIAWYAGNSGGTPHPVGEKAPNNLGLHDMHGNVFEWTGDWESGYTDETVIDPVGPAYGTKKVLRGGCCLCDANNCRAANRFAKTPDGKNFNIGFRVVMREESDDKKNNDATKQGEKTVRKMQIFDPPMCCSTGVCGPSVDENIVRFSADIDWVKSRGCLIERYNLSQQPGEFVKNALVKNTLEKEGNGCLPLIIVDGSIVHKGSYPLRSQLAGLVGLSIYPAQKLATAEVRELVAIGAAIACNCERCFTFHYNKARKLGVSDEDMLDAVEVGLKVKKASGEYMQEHADKYLKKNEQPYNPVTK